MIRKREIERERVTERERERETERSSLLLSGYQSTRKAHPQDRKEKNDWVITKSLEVGLRGGRFGYSINRMHPSGQSPGCRYRTSKKAVLLADSPQDVGSETI